MIVCTVIFNDLCDYYGCLQNHNNQNNQINYSSETTRKKINKRAVRAIRTIEQQIRCRKKR